MLPKEPQRPGLLTRGSIARKHGVTPPGVTNGTTASHGTIDILVEGSPPFDSPSSFAFDKKTLFIFSSRASAWQWPSTTENAPGHFFGLATC
jgi:hypothetical protein